MQRILPAGEGRQKLKQIWDEILSNPFNYFKEIEELEDISLIEAISRRIEVSPGRHLYFSNDSEKGVSDMASILSSIPSIGRFSSAENIYRAIKHEISTKILSDSETGNICLFDDVEEDILSRIFSAIKNYSYYFPIEGLDLNVNSEIVFGPIRIFKFDLNKMSIFLAQDAKVSSENEKYYRKFIEETLLGRICISFSCLGDQRFSEKLARLRIEEAISYLRYVLCLKFHNRIYEEIIPRIKFSFEEAKNLSQFLVRNIDSSALSLHWGPRRRNIRGHNFLLSDDVIVQLKEDCYYDRVAHLLNIRERTEMERLVMKGMHWIGEAQNDYNIDTSFIKYWTALECVFPKEYDPSKKSRTYIISRGVSMLLTDLGGYAFITDDEIFSTYKSVCMLYKKRGKVVHDGLRNGVNEFELAEICKLTCWTMLSLLHLASSEIAQFNEIKIKIGQRFGDLPPNVSQKCTDVSSRKGV